MVRTDPQQPHGNAVNVFRRRVLSWCADSGRVFPWRQPSATKYARVVSEVLLQRTRAETVAGFFPRFMREYPSWRSLGQATEAELRTFLQPLGIWRRRARSLVRLAQEMSDRSGRFPSDQESLNALTNVGQYVGNAAMLFCHGEPRPLIDAGMARVVERHFGPRRLADIRYDPYLQALALRIVQCDTPIEVNWGILDLAAMICHSQRPACGICPVRANCRSRRDRTSRSDQEIER